MIKKKEEKNVNEQKIKNSIQALILSKNKQEMIILNILKLWQNRSGMLLNLTVDLRGGEKRKKKNHENKQPVSEKSKVFGVYCKKNY